MSPSLLHSLLSSLLSAVVLVFFSSSLTRSRARCPSRSQRQAKQR
jgi:hypothetical protein